MHTQCVLSGIHNSNPLIQFNNNNKKNKNDNNNRNNNYDYYFCAGCLQLYIWNNIPRVYSVTAVLWLFFSYNSWYM
jgi:hypothetical protein